MEPKDIKSYDQKSFYRISEFSNPSNHTNDKGEKLQYNVQQYLSVNGRQPAYAGTGKFVASIDEAHEYIRSTELSRLDIEAWQAKKEFLSNYPPLQQQYPAAYDKLESLLKESHVSYQGKNYDGHTPEEAVLDAISDQLSLKDINMAKLPPSTFQSILTANVAKKPESLRDEAKAAAQEIKDLTDDFGPNLHYDKDLINQRNTLETSRKAYYIAADVIENATHTQSQKLTPIEKELLLFELQPIIIHGNTNCINITNFTAVGESAVRAATLLNKPLQTFPNPALKDQLPLIQLDANDIKEIKRKAQTPPYGVYPEYSVFATKSTSADDRLALNTVPYTGVFVFDNAIQPNNGSEFQVIASYENGQPYSVESVKDGSSTGLSREFHENMALKKNNFFFNDEFDGPQRNFYDNGRLAAERFFRKDEYVGAAREYHPNGQLALETNFKDNYRNGPYRKYNSEGILLLEENYKNDLRNGPAHYYFPDGTLKEIAEYKDNQIVGGQLKFYDSGYLAAKEYNHFNFNEKRGDIFPRIDTQIEFDMTSTPISFRKFDAKGQESATIGKNLPQEMPRLLDAAQGFMLREDPNFDLDSTHFYNNLHHVPLADTMHPTWHRVEVFANLYTNEITAVLRDDPGQEKRTPKDGQVLAKHAFSNAEEMREFLNHTTTRELLQHPALDEALSPQYFDKFVEDLHKDGYEVKGTEQLADFTPSEKATALKFLNDIVDVASKELALGEKDGAAKPMISVSKDGHTPSATLFILRKDGTPITREQYRPADKENALVPNSDQPLGRIQAHGIFQQFREDGTLERETEMQHNERVLDRLYDKNQHIAEQKFFKEGKETLADQALTDLTIYDDDNWVEREFYENGNLAEEQHLKNDLLNADGPTHVFSSNGNHTATRMYKDNAMNGTHLTFNDKGELQGTLNWKDGLLNGHFKVDCGDFIQEGHYKDGNFVGTITQQTRDGILLDISQYNDKGERDGYQFEFKHGNVVKTSEYKDGQLHGAVKTFDSDLHVTSAKFYKEGKEALAIVVLPKEQQQANGRTLLNDFDKDGNLARVRTMEKGKLHGYTSYYFPSGMVSRDVPYKNGKIDGVERLWNEKGIPTYEAPYIKGKLQGLEKKYYDTGELREMTAYKNDLRNGPSITFYPGKPEKTPMHIMHFVNGKRQGESKTLTQDGKLASLLYYKDNKEVPAREVMPDVEMTKDGHRIERTFHENGDIKSQKSYLNGQLDGPQYEFYEGNEVKSEVTYKEDQMVSPEIHYTPVGQIDHFVKNDEPIRLTPQGRDFTAIGVSAERVREALRLPADTLTTSPEGEKSITISKDQTLQLMETDNNIVISATKIEARETVDVTKIVADAEQKGRRVNFEEGYGTLLEGKERADALREEKETSKRVSDASLHGKEVGEASWEEIEKRVSHVQSYLDDATNKYKVIADVDGVRQEPREITSAEAVAISDGKISEESVAARAYADVIEANDKAQSQSQTQEQERTKGIGL